jgi:hypothetical protein
LPAQGIKEIGMLVWRAYKTELALTDQQVTASKQHAGAARWTYNWGLAVRQERYAATSCQSKVGRNAAQNGSHCHHYVRFCNPLIATGVGLCRKSLRVG